MLLTGNAKFVIFTTMKQESIFGYNCFCAQPEFDDSNLETHTAEYWAVNASKTVVVEGPCSKIFCFENMCFENFTVFVS